MNNPFASTWCRSFLILIATISAWPAAAAFVPSPDLLESPVLLADYIRWVKNLDAFSDNAETNAYQDVVTIVYDKEIDRPWGKDYFPEAQKRVDTLRGLICPAIGASSAICSLPAKIQSDADIKLLIAALTDPAMIEAMRARWGLAIHSVTTPSHQPQAFNLLVGSLDHITGEQFAYWDMNPDTVSWQMITPVLGDVESYLAGFAMDSFYLPFMLSRDGVVINDWHLRNTAMEFANHWKFSIRMNQGTPPTDAVVSSEDMQLQTVYDENRELFEEAYARLLPKTEAKPQAKARFLKEKAAGGYPEEVFEQVSYKLLSDLVHVQGGYYGLAQSQRKATSDRQKALESLLTLQKYAPSYRMFLVELTTRAEPFTSHAAVLSEAIDATTALTYEREQLNAILGLDVYTGSTLYPQMAYALTADELFTEYYLKNYRPDIYQEFTQPDGSLKKFASFSQADQLRILQSYVKDALGIARVFDVFATRVKEADLKELAEIIHKARSGNFH